MDYWQITRKQTAKPRARSGHIFLRRMICGTIQYNVIKPRSSNMTETYATASGRVTSSSKGCSGCMQPFFLVTASVTSCGASWPTNAAGWSFHSSKAGARTGASGSAAYTDSSVLSAGDTDGATVAGNLSLMCDTQAKTQTLAALQAPRVLPWFSILTNTRMSEAV